MIHNGNFYLRYYIIEAVNESKTRIHVSKSFTYMNSKKAKTHKHICALVLTSRKFVKLIYAMLHIINFIAKRDVLMMIELF